MTRRYGVSGEAVAGVRPAQGPVRTHFGAECLRALADELAEVGAARVHIVTARSLLGTETLRSLRNVSPLLENASVSTVAGHLPLADVRSTTLAILDGGADAVIALGGGSAIDAAKFGAFAAASGLVDPASPAAALKEVIVSEAPGRVLPIFCVPTTLSAAELYGDVGFTDDTGQKAGAHNPALTPTAVFYDPAMASGTPRALWVSTGVRALDHAIESVASPSIDPLSRLLATSAVDDLLALLPRFKVGMGSADDRLRSYIAAWKSYGAPAIASQGLSHIIGRAIGARNGIPHGITSCVVLPNAIRLLSRTDPAARERFDELADDLRMPRAAGDSVPLALLIELIVETAGLPTRFSREQLPPAARAEAVDLAAAQSGAPLELVEEIVTACVEG